MAELIGFGPYNTPRSWLARAEEDGELDIAEDQHVALGVNGYMFTPYIWARGLVACPFCSDEYINAEFFKAHLERDHTEQEQNQHKRDQEARTQNAKPGRDEGSSGDTRQASFATRQARGEHRPNSARSGQATSTGNTDSPGRYSVHSRSQRHT